MKKLISAKEIEDLKNRGEKIFYINSDTIITPSAKDVAKINGIVFAEEVPVCEVEEVKYSETVNADEDGIDREMIYKVFKTMNDKGLLEGVLDSLSN
jgi:ethanolamine utilization protein EutQ